MLLRIRPCMFMLAAATVMAQPGCSKKKDKDEDKSEAVATMGTLSLQPNNVFKTVETSLKGLGAGVAGIGGATNFQLDGDGPFTCHEETNEPVDAKDPSKNTDGGQWLPQTDPRYGTFKLACVLNGTSDNSTSIMGSFELPRVFGCALSSLSELAFDGVERDVKIPVTKTCFGSLVDDPDTGLQDGGEIDAKVTLTRPSPVEGWDYTLTVKANDADIRMHFGGDLQTTASFAIYQSGQQPWGDDGIALALDFAKGEIRYVYRRDITNCDGKSGDELKTCFGPGNNDDEWEGTSNLALLAKGSFNADQEFTLTDIHGAHTRAYASGEANARTYMASIFTLSGSLTSGATQHSYTANGVSLEAFLKAATFQENASHELCFKHEQDPTAGSCADNPGVKLEDDDDTIFTIHPGDSRHPRNMDWFGNGPLSFEAIDLSNSAL